MKIVYCIQQIYNSGGMERVLANKANYLSRNHDVTIITTDQKHRQPFYKLSEDVTLIDLAINYEDNQNRKSYLLKGICYFLNRIRHRRRLKKEMMQLKADVAISMFNQEVTILPYLKDGSKKVLEFHFCRGSYHFSSNNTSLINRFLGKVETYIYKDCKHDYDAFVVLTEEDKANWSEYANVCAIPNARSFSVDSPATLDAKRVLAVGHYLPIKGFERLIYAWQKVNQVFPDWILSIVGEGPQRQFLQDIIDKLGLTEHVILEGVSYEIKREYLTSSIFVMTSFSEGFSMTIIEAESAGLPVVSFNCPCGPKDIIQDGMDGFLVENGDIDGLADRIILLIQDADLRKEMGGKAYMNSNRFSEVTVMTQWEDLFHMI